MSTKQTSVLAQRDKLYDAGIRTISFLLVVTLAYLLWTAAFVSISLPMWVFWMGNAVVAGLSILYAWTSGLYYTWRSVLLPHQSNVPATQQTFNPVEVAQLSFKLDDPEGEEELDTFLDEPLYQTSSLPGQLASPSQMTETMIFDHVKNINSAFPNMVEVEVEVRRGSLVVALTYVAIAYTLISQYNDFVESISRLHRQMRGTFATMSGHYREQTQRNIRVRGDLFVKYRSRNSFIEPNGNSRAGIPESQPVTITNAYNPPPNNHDLNINVNVPSSRRFGCQSLLLLIFVLSTGVGILYFYFVLDTEAKLKFLQMAVEQIIWTLQQIGQYLIDLSARIRHEAFGE